MSDLAARFAYSPLLSTAFKVVCLFCVLGLALSVAIVPMIAPEPSTAGTCSFPGTRQPCSIARRRIGRNTASAMTAATMLRIAAT